MGWIVFELNVDISAADEPCIREWAGGKAYRLPKAFMGMPVPR